ncbi:MAG: hypothetical protein P1V97_18630 [Planctomycetota bacterium]|nr:hypothetical protein [Planctomycetota bacterium]
MDYRFPNLGDARKRIFSKNKAILYIAANTGFHVRKFGNPDFERAYDFGEVLSLEKAKDDGKVYVFRGHCQQLDLKELVWNEVSKKSESLWRITDHPKKKLQLKSYADRVRV